MASLPRGLVVNRPQQTRSVASWRNACNPLVARSSLEALTVKRRYSDIKFFLPPFFRPAHGMAC